MVSAQFCPSASKLSRNCPKIRIWEKDPGIHQEPSVGWLGWKVLNMPSYILKSGGIHRTIGEGI